MNTFPVPDFSKDIQQLTNIGCSINPVFCLDYNHWNTALTAITTSYNLLGLLNFTMQLLAANICVHITPLIYFFSSDTSINGDLPQHLPI
jgi:hypothetical protein